MLNKILQLPLSPAADDGEQAEMEQEVVALPREPITEVQMPAPQAVVPSCQSEVFVYDKRFPIALLKCPVKVMEVFNDVYHVKPWAVCELIDARRRKKNQYHQRITRARQGKSKAAIAEESDYEGDCETFDMPDALSKLEIALGARYIRTQP